MSSSSTVITEPPCSQPCSSPAWSESAANAAANEGEAASAVDEAAAPRLSARPKNSSRFVSELCFGVLSANAPPKGSGGDVSKGSTETAVAVAWGGASACCIWGCVLEKGSCETIGEVGRTGFAAGSGGAGAGGADDDPNGSKEAGDAASREGAETEEGGGGLVDAPKGSKDGDVAALNGCSALDGAVLFADFEAPKGSKFDIACVGGVVN
mmetsp:Transcript_54711/g.109992  ORF Transcript_54711/g.109992 Transcript_54711/m.109992 type:complete len:211 (+) Transcript_54711:445-1077(+)